MESKITYACAVFLIALGTVAQSGCMTVANQTIPAARLPDCLRGESRSAQCAINFASLRQAPPAEYKLAAGDTLGITIRGVLPASTEAAPVIQMERFQNTQYYPPGGLANTPTVGVPIDVQSDGKLRLPLIEPLDVTGLTIQQVADKLAEVYRSAGMIQPDREQIHVSLIKARTYRVLVVREDTPGSPTLISRTQYPLTKMGSGTLVDLPAYENDVLHALTATGGLPGIDAHNSVWVLRSRSACEQSIHQAHAQLTIEGQDAGVLLASCPTEFTRTHIPLRVNPCEVLPFGPTDVILNEGDVVYVEPRVADVFYTGGLLPPGSFPLPRDHDVDVLEAIAIATGGVGSAAIGTGTQPIRSGAGPGNILVPPGRAIIIRKLADGRQVRIRVDMRKALHDSSERICILPNDFVMMQFTPSQCVSNTVLNWFNWNVTVIPSQFVTD